LVAGLLILKRAGDRPARVAGPVPAASAEPNPITRLPWVLAGILIVALLAGGQLVHRPKNFVVQSSAGLSERQVARVLELHDQTFQIDLRETPLHGSPDASNVVVHLFDYTCPHCRALHPILKQAWANLSNQVAFVSLLVPLASNCNPIVKRQVEQHRTACDLAYAGLAVWRVQRDQLPAFEDWVFSTPRLPLPEAARAKGRELVGTNQFDSALNDPWIRQHLTRNINLYTTNYLRFRKQVLPELMIGTNLVSGTVRGLPDLYKLLSEQFPLQIPQ
jgi:protein-disulfide isomerase